MNLNGGLVLMSVRTDKPNFRIIENYEPDVDYEEFKKDFLNPMILKDELIKKYDISNKVYCRYRDKVLDETGLLKKPSCTQPDRIKPSLAQRNSEFIKKVGDFYVVAKRIRYTNYYFGRYSDYDTAKMVRDRLVESNWDLALGDELKKLYALKRHKPALEKAKRLFDEFEKRYFFDDEHTLKEIFEEMNIEGSVYHYLLMMLREKHGRVKRSMYR